MQVGGKFYLAGGGTAHQKYDPQTNVWSNVKPLPAALDHIQGVALGGKIYYIGGLQTWPSPHVSTVYIYDPQTDSFSTGASMGTRGRGAGGVAAYDGKIYYAGGLSNGQAVNWLDVYDPQSNQWSALPNMPTARDHFHAVALNGKLWAIGGRTKDIGATVTANEAFDFSSKTWSAGHKPLPTPRGGFAAAASGDEVLIIGGEDASKAHGTVEAYNVKTDSWRTLESMPTPRHGIQAASCNGGLYIAAGGTAPGHHPSQAHEAYFPGGVKTACGAQVSFAKKGVSGMSSSRPTSMQFGPDGRLYVSSQDGTIKAYTVTRSSAGAYSVTATETITAIKSMPNRNDGGQLDSSVSGRLVTGIAVAGSAAAPVIYVGSSDPRIGAGTSGADLNLDTNSGVLSKLTKSGSGWVKQDLVRGLPRSEENHTMNGLALSPDGNTLYVAQGGNTNKGGPSNNFALLPEYALSAAILSVSLPAIGAGTYDLPTLDDPTRTGTPDAGDPFGGNDGANQARLPTTGPVKVYAPGFRNAYDVLVTSTGKMYSIDNGGNGGWGGVPIGEGPGGTCSNARSEPGVSDRDALHLVSGPGYYAGHPNPTRANKANTFGGQSPIDGSANPVECDFRSPGTATGSGNDAGALATFGASTNGLTEYTASNFAGSMTGDLLTTSLDNTIKRITPVSSTKAEATNLVSSAGAGGGPLDIIAQPDGGPFPGTVWYGDVYGSAIYVLEPADYGGGSAPTCDLSLTDSDGDGFSNADENANGTDPCSPADKPPDFDGDKVSDATDADDDNDNVSDKTDAFARDANNGLNTPLPVEHLWENDSPAAGGLLNLGFTGLMTNGTADYLTQYDATKMTAGGAAGVVTVDQVPEGDAYAALNTQQYGFQFGVKARPADGPFTVHTRIAAPFNGIAPADYQSMGLFLGTGDQDNYVKLTTTHNTTTGVEVLKEVNGVPSNATSPLTLPGPAYVDLYLRVDPSAGTVQASYTATTGQTTTPRTNVGAPITVPTGWFTDTAKGLAAGIISTSNGPGVPFPATWDFIRVTPETSTPPPPPGGGDIAQDDFTRSVASGWGSAQTGGPWSVAAGPAADFTVAGGMGRIATPGGASERLVHLGSTSARDVEMTSEVTLEPAPASGIFAYDILRRQASGTHLRVGVHPLGGKLHFRGQTNTGQSLFPDVDSGIAFTAGAYLLRVRVEGASPTRVRARVWKAGTSEPSTWQVDQTTSAGPQTAGSLGIRTVNTTATPTNVHFDAVRASATGTSTPPQDTTPPAVPTGLTATAGDGQVALTWNGVADGDLAGYEVYRSGGGETDKLVSQQGITTSYVDATAVNGTSYTYTVKSYDTAGNASAASAGAAATPTAPSPAGVLARDDFARTVSGGWGAADVGGAWSVLAGAAGSFSVAGGTGSVASPGGFAQQVIHLASTSARDVDVKAAITFGATPTSGIFGYYVLRRQAGGSYLRIGAHPLNGRLYLRIQTEAGTTVFADVDTGVSFAAGSYHLRAQVQGANPTTVRARLWKTGTSEPAVWQLEKTTTLGPQTAGSVGLRAVNMTSTATTLKIDELVVNSSGT